MEININVDWNIVTIFIYLFFVFVVTSLPLWIIVWIVVFDRIVLGLCREGCHADSMLGAMSRGVELMHYFGDRRSLQS